jgi:molybdopterin-synthase adenylyltransferase
VNPGIPIGPPRGLRLLRQAEIIPQAELDRVAAVVIGCGAIGSWLTKFLAHMGVPHLTLVDPESVDPENLALQGFTEQDLGQPKAECLTYAAWAINDRCEVNPIVSRFRREHLETVPARFDRVVVYVGVDSIEARGRIYRMARRRCSLFIDGRMAALAWSVLTVDNFLGDWYETTLFDPAEAYPLRCTAKGTVCTAAAPALQMATQLMLWLKGCSIRDRTLAQLVEGNLLATSQKAAFQVACWLVAEGV